MDRSDSEIGKLMNCIARLPGVGGRTAMRIVIHLIKRKSSVLDALLKLLIVVRNKAVVCEVCGNIDDKSPCSICADTNRDRSVICIVCDISDLWVVEKSGVFKGVYHVLGGKLSALDGTTPADLSIASLHLRLKSEPQISEVIFAISADLDGQTTMFFVKNKIDDCCVKMTTLSHGIPVGGDLEYLDDGTIVAAFSQRRTI